MIVYSRPCSEDSLYNLHTRDRSARVAIVEDASNRWHMLISVELEYVQTVGKELIT
jgi:hypothetical protein